MTDGTEQPTQPEMAGFISQLNALVVEQEANGCLVFVRFGDGIYPVMGADYDPGVEGESFYENEDGTSGHDGVEDESSTDDEARVFLRIGEAIN